MIKPYYLETGKLVKIDGLRGIEEVRRDIQAHLSKIKKK
jgi:adenylate kinase family enzyme